MIPLLALFNTYITTAIDADDTSVVVDDVTSIPTAPFHVIIGLGSEDEEVVRVTAVATATKTLTVVRAQVGTTGVAHGDNSLLHACEMNAAHLSLDDMTRTLTGSSAASAMLLTVTDTTTQTSGISRGIAVDYTQSGTKTSTAEVNCITVDLLLSADVPYAYGFVFYAYDSGDPTIGLLAAVSIYIADCGTAVTHICAIDIGLAQGSNSPADRHCFIRMRAHSAGAKPDCVFQLEGANAADYLFSFDSAAGNGCVVASGLTVATGDAPYLAIRLNSVDYGIAIVAI